MEFDRTGDNTANPWSTLLVFSVMISKVYGTVLFISALALFGNSLVSAIGLLGLLAMLKGVPLIVKVSAITKFVCLILLGLILCAFLAKKSKYLKTHRSVGTFALLAQVLSIIGLLLAIPWLYFLMNASYSWYAQMMPGIAVPFDFWANVVAAGIILHELAEKPPFEIEKKRHGSRMNFNELSDMVDPQRRLDP